MAIQEFEKTSDGRENHNSSGLRASFGGSSGVSLWAGLLVSARRRSYQEKRTFGVHAILPLRLHFHFLGMDREFQELFIVRSNGQDARHEPGPQPLNDRSEFL